MYAIDTRIWSHALPEAKTPKVQANGTLPMRANPAAVPNISCSATPSPKNLSGNSFLNHSARVESVRSAERTTTSLLALPSSIKAFPNPSLVGTIFNAASAIFFSK